MDERTSVGPEHTGERIANATGPVADRRRYWAPALVASGALVAYGNAATAATWLPGAWSVVPMLGHPLLVAAAVAWGRGPARLSWAELGLSRTGWARSAIQGLVLGAGMALLVVAPLLLARAIGWGSSTVYPRADEGGGVALVGLRLLVLTALCEEFWFRGLLQPCWVRIAGPRAGVLIQATLFATWHLAIWGWTLQRVTLTPAYFLAVAYPAGLAILWIAGLLFGWLRQRTGHLAGPIVAHWAIDVVLVALVWGGWL